MTFNKIKLVRIYCIVLLVFQFFYQVGNYKIHSRKGLQYLIVFQWLAWLIMTGLTLKSFESGKELLVKYLIIIMTFRISVVLIDFEGFRNSDNNLDPIRIICVFGITALMGQFCIFQIWDGNFLVNTATVIVNQTTICLGVLILSEEKLESIQIPMTFFEVSRKHAYDGAMIFIGLLITQYIFIKFQSIEKYGFLMSCYHKTQYKREYFMYLDNLEEAVISKSGEGLRYFNSKGMNLINKCIDSHFSKVL